MGFLTIALQSSRSRHCVQVAGAVDKPNQGGNADNAAAELWDCNENPRQRWQLLHVGGATFELQSANSKKCLTMPAGKVNADVRLVQLTCSATSTQQHWEFIDTGRNTMELRNVASNKAVTASGSAISNGTAVGQTANTHTLDHQWRVIDFSHHQVAAPAISGKVSLKGAQSGRCLQIAGVTNKPNDGAHRNNAPAELWDCNRNPRQVWEVVQVAGNRFALKNGLSGKCLDILGAGVGYGLAVNQWPCHLRGNQQWVLMVTDKDGAFMLRNALTGTYVDVKAPAVANGSPIVSWGYTGKGNQQWGVQTIS